jgi:protein-tyrosine-phosphatase
MDRPRPLPQALLFACAHNTIRSPMAAALFKLRFGNRVWVESCGVRKGLEPDPFVIAVMDELGVDMSRHRAKTFDDLDDDSFDMIVTLAPEAHHRALELTRTMAVDVEYWPTMDPTIVQGSRAQQLEEYRAVRDSLDRQIAQRFERPILG